MTTADELIRVANKHAADRLVDVKKQELAELQEAIREKLEQSAAAYVYRVFVERHENLFPDPSRKLKALTAEYASARDELQSLLDQQRLVDAEVSTLKPWVAKFDWS